MRMRQVSSWRSNDSRSDGASLMSGSGADRLASPLTGATPPSRGRQLRGGLRAVALEVGKRDGRDRRRPGRVFGVVEGELGCHRPVGARAAQRDAQRLEGMTERVVDGRALEAAVRHAIVATPVAADAVALPLGVLHQGAIGGGIALIGQQVAGALPAEDVVRRIAPRGALVALVAGEEVEVQARVIEGPAPTPA